MLGKLLKHEFRATGRIMLPVMGVLTLLALMFNVSVRLIDEVNSDLLRLLFGIVIFAFAVGIIAAEVIAVLLMINRFYKNLLGEEGYLMFTLPTNVHGLVWSKLIVSFVWFLLTNLLILLIAALTVLSFNKLELAEMFSNLPKLSEMLRELAEYGIYPGDFAVLGIEWLLAMIAGALTSCLHFYAAMALGHSFSNHKGLYSVLFFVALSILGQFITGAVGINGIGFMEELMMADTPVLVIRNIKLVLAMGLGWELVLGALLYVITTLSLKLRLNLA